MAGPHRPRRSSRRGSSIRCGSGHRGGRGDAQRLRVGDSAPASRCQRGLLRAALRASAPTSARSPRVLRARCARCVRPVAALRAPARRRRGVDLPLLGRARKRSRGGCGRGRGGRGGRDHGRAALVTVRAAEDLGRADRPGHSRRSPRRHDPSTTRPADLTPRTGRSPGSRARSGGAARRRRRACAYRPRDARHRRAQPQRDHLAGRRCRLCDDILAAARERGDRQGLGDRPPGASGNAPAARRAARGRARAAACTSAGPGSARRPVGSGPCRGHSGHDGSRRRPAQLARGRPAHRVPCRAGGADEHAQARGAPYERPSGSALPGTKRRAGGHRHRTGRRADRATSLARRE